jgi:hypothetical protein
MGKKKEIEHQKKLNASIEAFSEKQRAEINNLKQQLQDLNDGNGKYTFPCGKIEAIQQLRAVTGMHLVDSKNIVDAVIQLLETGTIKDTTQLGLHVSNVRHLHNKDIESHG